MSRVNCAACQHAIDEAAKICPYCGSDPKTGQKIVDTAAILQQEFTPRKLSPSESVMEYARQRQGVVIAVSVIVAFIILAALHQYVTMRNETAVSDAPAVPLAEVTDVSNQQDENKPQPVPDLKFQYEGHSQSMRNYIVEAGAVTPPEVLAEQQAAAQAAAAKQPPPAPAGPKPAVPAPRAPQPVSTQPARP